MPDGKTDKSAVANVGYARVSTLGQDLSLQLDALAAAGCGKVFEDHASGVRADRAGLQAALDYVRDGEMLVVWKLDRLGRSLPRMHPRLNPGMRQTTRDCLSTGWNLRSSMLQQRLGQE